MTRASAFATSWSDSSGPIPSDWSRHKRSAVQVRGPTGLRPARRTAIWSNCSTTTHDWRDALLTSITQALALFLTAILKVIGFLIIIATDWLIAMSGRCGCGLAAHWEGAAGQQDSASFRDAFSTLIWKPPPTTHTTSAPYVSADANIRRRIQAATLIRHSSGMRTPTLAAPCACIPCDRSRRYAAGGAGDAWAREHRHNERLLARAAGELERPQAQYWGVSSMMPPRMRQQTPEAPAIAGEFGQTSLIETATSNAAQCRGNKDRAPSTK